MGQALTELLNALASLLSLIDPNNEKNLGLRISLFFNAAFLALVCLVAVKAEPYLVDCGANKAQVIGLHKLLEEERKNSTSKSQRIMELEGHWDKVK